MLENAKVGDRVVVSKHASDSHRPELATIVEVSRRENPIVRYDNRNLGWDRGRGPGHWYVSREEMSLATSVDEEELRVDVCHYDLD